jgi:DNA-binding MarR family transcriptional regulator
MPPEVLENALGYNFNRVYVLLRREFLRTLAEYNMTPEQWHVMMTLWSTGHPLNQREIIRMTLKDKPTVSRMIQRLEHNGWIEKGASQLDGRVTIIQPTKKGMKLKKEVPQKLIPHFDTFWKQLGEEDEQTLFRILKKLRHILGDYS